MVKADLYGALARGYCSEKNSGKTVDPELIEAMADEILLLYCQKKGATMTYKKDRICPLIKEKCKKECCEFYVFLKTYSVHRVCAIKDMAYIVRKMGGF